MEREINFAIAQMEVSPGHPDVNVAKILKETESAKERKIDVILFPEMAVPGYLLGDEWENDNLIADLTEYNDRILRASRGIAIMWGNIHADFGKKNEDGRTRKYNAVHVAQNGAWVDNGVFKGHTYKTLMPEYREFDDPRHFFSMAKLAAEENKDIETLLNPFPIEVNGENVLIGAILCEDMWCDDYSVNPTHILVKNGAEVVVNLSASPWTWRKNDKRHRIVASLLQKDPVPFIYCNNVGVQNNGKNIFLFDGSSAVYNSDGSLAHEIGPYQEKTLDVRIPSNKKVEIKTRLPYDKEDVIELHRGLVYGIRKFFDQRFPSKRAVIGISGGIDSAVDACLLVEALGKDRVLGVNMPYIFNKDLTKNAAHELALNLGIEYKVIPIQEGVDLTVRDIRAAGFPVTDFNLENIQARDRGSTILAAIAGSLDAVFINNGNKTETAFGYATLYGDIDGALAPLQDVYKGEVYDLARYINEVAGIPFIPEATINVVPSAELSDKQDVTKGQGDPIIYPIHDKYVKAFVEFRMDPEKLLDLYINGKLDQELKIPSGLINKHFPTPQSFVADLEEKWKLYKIMIFKRIPSTVGISVSKRSFGFDLRESQNGVYFTQRYLKLKKGLLN